MFCVCNKRNKNIRQVTTFCGILLYIMTNRFAEFYNFSNQEVQMVQMRNFEF